jgi:hypothetical protein
LTVEHLFFSKVGYRIGLDKESERWDEIGKKINVPILFLSINLNAMDVLNIFCKNGYEFLSHSVSICSTDGVFIDHIHSYVLKSGV